MTESKTKIAVTKINLHQKSRILEIGFTDSFEFNFPCEYLRVFSTAAEVKVAKQPIAGKAQVNINKIEPQGNYALRLFFDDGHDTGIFSWETLYNLAKNYQKNWQEYNQRLEQFKLKRGVIDTDGTLNSSKSISILYFMQLANIAETSSETLSLDSNIKTVEDLLVFLCARNETWKASFTSAKVQVTVNKQFTESYTPIEDGDEVAIVPRAE